MKSTTRREFVHRRTSEHGLLVTPLMQDSRILSPSGRRDDLERWLDLTGYSVYRIEGTVIGLTTRAFIPDPESMPPPTEWWYLAFILEDDVVVDFVWLKNKVAAEAQVEAWKAQIDPGPDYLF